MKLQKPSVRMKRWSAMLASVSVPLVLYACALPQPVGMPALPQAVGIEQVRDPLTGKLYHVACNPCADRTVKTLVDPSSIQGRVVDENSQGAVNPVAPVVSVVDKPQEALQALAHPVPKASETAELKLEAEFTSVKRTVPFSFARTGMGPKARLAVEELIPLAKQSAKIWVRGRTDSVGTAEANKVIAQSRASTVRQEFIAAGVPKAKIVTTYCTDCFIAPNDTEKGRRSNRRVDVELEMPTKVAKGLPSPVHAVPEIRLSLATATGMGSWQEKVDSN